MNTDGSELRNITSDPADDRLPSWSPDSRRIAFSSNRSGNFEIYTMNPDGTDVVQVTEVNGYNCTDPAWSPDGQFIAYMIFNGVIGPQSNCILMIAPFGPETILPIKERSRPTDLYNKIDFRPTRLDRARGL